MDKNVITIKIRKTRKKKIVKNISYYEEIIRNYINSPINLNNLIKNTNLWNQICSSLDVIGDTELAIEIYGKYNFGLNKKTRQATINGASYIIIYGLMQSLILQQDAVNHLCQALKCKENIFDSLVLKETRELRSESVGHPTKKNKSLLSKVIPSYHYISRHNMNKMGFEMLSYENNDHKFKYVDIFEIIKKQQKEIMRILKSITDELKKRELEYKNKFEKDPLVNIFTGSIGYEISKIHEAVYCETEASYKCHMAISHLKSIESKLVQLERKLEQRGIDIDTYDEIKLFFHEMKSPISRLKQYLNSMKAGLQGNEVIDKTTAVVYAYYVDKRIHELIDFLKAVDREFQTKQEEN